MMEEYQKRMQDLAVRLYEINAIKFGDFKMKVGINSPIYFDLRVIVSYPDVMDELTNLLTIYIVEKGIKNLQHMCGVPYTALPIATLISVKSSTPMLIRRKEAKEYGTKKLIEGKFNAGDNCLIIEDVVTSGSSILDTVADLKSEGIQVTDAIVVLDREQGGADNIALNGVKMHSLFTLSKLLDILNAKGKIDVNTIKSVAVYIKGCQIKSDGTFAVKDTKIVNKLSRVNMSFADRSDMAKCAITKTLFNIMETKKTNLCLAADLTKSKDILNLVEATGPYICILKTHVDIIEDFSENFVNSLKSLAKRHNFLILEDRKFADIGNTVASQYGSGMYRIADWADLITVHSLPGQSILQGLKSALGTNKNRGVFLLGEMSSQGNLITPGYTDATMKIATEGTDVDFVCGIVCQSPSVVMSPGLIQLTPGVKIDEVTDNLGQQYNTPEFAVKEKGADIAVVGRGITNAKNCEQAAVLYRDRLWTAYCERTNATE